MTWECPKPTPATPDQIGENRARNTPICDVLRPRIVANPSRPPTHSIPVASLGTRPEKNQTAAGFRPDGGSVYAAGSSPDGTGLLDTVAFACGPFTTCLADSQATISSGSR